MIYDAAALLSRLQQGRIVGAPTSSRMSVTGEAYVMIGDQLRSRSKDLGTVDEGQEFEWAFCPETAYWSAVANFDTYAFERPGVLYWRMEPVLENIRRHYRFYMRCLISDKPPLARAA